jgi:hypothetical protein
MKKYDRESGKWIEEKEMEGKLSKRKLCKGGREHEWMLCLPSYLTVASSALGLDKVEEYYKIEDEREDAEIAFDERLEAIGIKSRSFRISRLLGRRRSYICTVCYKQS